MSGSCPINFDDCPDCEYCEGQECNYDEDKADADWEDHYDIWRDHWHEKLEEVLTDAFNMFVKVKGKGYYKDSPERFEQHCKSILSSLANRQDTEGKNEKRI